MKKLLSIAVVIVLLTSGLFILTGCDKEQNGGTKINAKEYVIDAKFGGKFTFEFPEDLGYEVKEETNNLVLTHKDNKSTITVYAMDTSKASIIMKEKDFSADAYTGYKEIEINGHKGYTINKTNNFAVTYGLLLGEDPRGEYKYYGVKIVVSKNSLKLDEFDPAAFVQTEAFQHLLNSIKVTPPEAEQTTQQ